MILFQPVANQWLKFLTFCAKYSNIFAIIYFFLNNISFSFTAVYTRVKIIRTLFIYSLNSAMLIKLTKNPNIDGVQSFILLVFIYYGLYAI